MAGLLAAVGWLLGGPTGVLWTFGAALLSLWLAPSPLPAQLLRAQGARPLHPAEAPGLHASVAELARRAKLGSAPPIYLVPAPVPQAFATGSGTETAIGVTPALLRLLHPREVLAVLAHEVSHLRRRDIRMMRVAAVVRSLTRTMAFVGLLLLAFNLPLLAATGQGVPWLAVALLLGAPWLVNLLGLALSRSRELDADLGAVALTGQPLVLASALLKLERASRGPWWMAVLTAELPSYLLTHPRTEERVARLRELARDERSSAGPPPPRSTPRGGTRRVVIPEWRRAPRPVW